MGMRSLPILRGLAEDRSHARDLWTAVNPVALLDDTDCNRRRIPLDAQRIGTTLRSLP